MAVIDSLLVKEIENHFSDLDRRLDDLHSMAAISQDCIANELAASDRYVTITGIVISIILVFVGLYVSHLYDKIKVLKNDTQSASQEVNRMRRQVDSKIQEVQVLKKEVEETNKQINNDLSSIYVKLKREETISLLKRLVDVPEDISNISPLLFSRELLEEDFDLLVDAYKKIKETGHNAKISLYSLVFFQHFAGRSLRVAELADYFKDNFEFLISQSFKNDIIKSTNDMISELANFSPEERISFVVPYYAALKKSKYKDRYDLCSLLNSILTDEQWASVIATTDEGREE